MAQFDVHRLAGGTLAVDCQANLLSDLNTRFVIPLQPLNEGAQVSQRLDPFVRFAGQERCLKTHFATTIETRLLGEAIGSVADQDYAIKSAIDMLLFGF
jgi:toxin CcdB